MNRSWPVAAPLTLFLFQFFFSRAVTRLLTPGIHDAYSGGEVLASVTLYFSEMSMLVCGAESVVAIIDILPEMPSIVKRRGTEMAYATMIFGVSSLFIF